MNSLAFQILEHSEYGTEMPAQQQLIKNQNALNAIYQKIFSNISPQPEPPEIDFKHKNVLFLHFGTYNHGGNSFKIDSIKNLNQQINVYLKLKSPAAGQPSLTVMTYPFMLIEIDKPQTEVQKINVIKNPKFKNE